MPISNRRGCCTSRQNSGPALDRLVELGVVRKIERKGLAPAAIEVGEQVFSKAFGRGVIVSTLGPATIEIGARVTHKTFADGVIVSVQKSGGPVGVRFDDGEYRSIRPSYLQAEVPPVVKFDDGSHRSMSPASLQAEATVALFGLSRLLLDHAAELLNRPGFVPNAAQRRVVLQAFKYRFSICTWPPGTGKTTAVVSLVCAAAARIYPGDASPILGVALSGRAASMMRDAAVWWNDDGEAITMTASTIHPALQMDSVDDDDFVVYGRIECRGLVSEESSIDSSPLLAALLTHTSARHVIFIGEQQELQPLDPGSPFRDMIASGVIPTVYLTENYRTNCIGILTLCDDILNGTVSAKKLPEYLSLGGVFYVPCDYKSRPYMVAQHYADVAAQGVTPNNIRVLSPHNTGDGGTKSINIEVREALEFPPDNLVVGDILLVTQNDYEAPCPSGGDTVIFNGELCEVFNVGPDFIDVEFDENCDVVRRVRLLLGDGLDAASRLPAGVAFGRAMSVHKGQGSQFRAAIVLAEKGNDRFGIVQKSIIYTAISRGIDRVIIIVDFEDLVDAALTPDLPRNTLLRDLLINGARK